MSGVPPRKDRRGAHMPKTARHPMILARPTPELQKRYNHMKRLHEMLSFGDKLQIQDGSTDTDGTRLQPPGVPGMPGVPKSAGAQMARSVSAASSRSTEGNHGAKHRACRRGPLTEYERARTSFTRKLKACTSCRSRRVRCEHHDLRLLEAAYQQEQEQATAQPWSTPDATITTDLDISTLSDITISGPSPQDLMDQTCPSTADSLLIGIHDTPSSANIPSTQHFNSDISQILEDVSLTTNPGLAFQPSSSTGIDTTFPPASRELQIAIGRVRQDGMWECQHSLKTGCQPASPGIWASGGIWAAHLCGTAFLDHCDLLAHFRSHHFNVEEASPPFVNKCQRCGCLKDIRPSCPGCSGEVFDLWYFGTRAEHSNNQSQSRRALWIPSTGVGAGFGSGSFGSGSGSAGHGFPSSFSGAYGTGEYGAGTDGSSTSAYGGYLYSPHCHSTETTTTLPRNISSGQTGKLDMGLKQSLYQPTTKLPSWKHLRWVANHIVSKYLCLFIASIILVISDRVGVLPLLGTCLGANSLRVAIAWATSASCCIAVVGAVAILISSVLGIETSFPALEEVYRGAVVDIG